MMAPRGVRLAERGGQLAEPAYHLDVLVDEVLEHRSLDADSVDLAHREDPHACIAE